VKNALSGMRDHHGGTESTEARSNHFNCSTSSEGGVARGARKNGGNAESFFGNYFLLILAFLAFLAVQFGTSIL
jgi:hypothetical protein